MSEPQDHTASRRAAGASGGCQPLLVCTTHLCRRRRRCACWPAEDKPQAAATKHIHWHDLEPVVRAHPETQFVLYHFSRRYKRAWVRDHFAALALPNVIAWCN